MFDQVYLIRVDVYHKIIWFHEIRPNGDVKGNASKFLNKSLEAQDVTGLYENYSVNKYPTKSLRESVGVLKSKYKLMKSREPYRRGYSKFSTRLEPK